MTRQSTPAGSSAIIFAVLVSSLHVDGWSAEAVILEGIKYCPKLTLVEPSLQRNLLSSNDADTMLPHPQTSSW